MKNLKNTKRIVVLILTLSLAASVASCAKEEEEETEEDELLYGEDRALEVRFNDIEDSYRNCDDPYSVLEWRPVSEVIG